MDERPVEVIANSEKASVGGQQRLADVGQRMSEENFRSALIAQIHGPQCLASFIVADGVGRVLAMGHADRLKRPVLGERADLCQFEPLVLALGAREIVRVQSIRTAPPEPYLAPGVGDELCDRWPVAYLQAALAAIDVQGENTGIGLFVLSCLDEHGVLVFRRYIDDLIATLATEILECLARIFGILLNGIRTPARCKRRVQPHGHCHVQVLR